MQHMLVANWAQRLGGGGEGEGGGGGGGVLRNVHAGSRLQD